MGKWRRVAVRAAFAERLSKEFPDGRKVGPWTVLGIVDEAQGVLVRVMCACGVQRALGRRQVNEARGCKRCCRRKHGEAADRRSTTEYRAWLSMKRRCANPRAAFAYRYSERGITVCQRWRSSFEAFLADLGRRPEGAYSLDRRDNNAGYTCGACPECAANGWPMNCRWASNFEQSVNKETTARVYVFGADVSIRRLAKIFALNSKTVKGRLRRGWPVERALTTPVTQTRRWHARDAA